MRWGRCRRRRLPASTKPLYCSWCAAPTKKSRSAGPRHKRFYGIAEGEDEGGFLAQLRAVEPSNAETLAVAFDRQRSLRASYQRIVRSPDLLRPIIAAKDVAEDEGGSRRQIAATVFDSFAPQLDLSFAATAYGLVGLFLGSLIGELLVAALLPRHRFAQTDKP